jgi:DHA1 family multidrug resistance protein-like MFS transporter
LAARASAATLSGLASQTWKRTFVAVWAANLITAIGMQAFLPFFASHLEALGMRDRDSVALWAGLLFGAAPLSAAIASPLWGALGDRFGRRLMVLRSMLAITVFVGAMAFARSEWELLGLRVAQGLFSGFLAPSLTLVSVQAPPQAQSRVTAWLNTSMVLGAVVGPALGEVLRHQLSLVAVYSVVAGLAGLSAVLVLLLAHETPRETTPGEPTSIRAILRASFGDIAQLRANPALRSAVVLSFWIQFGLGATNPLLELHVRDLDSLVPSLPVSTSALFSTMAVANLVAMPWWGSIGDRRGAYRALVGCAVGCTAALAAQALASSYEALLLSRIAFGAAIAGSGPLAFGVAAQESSLSQRGGAMGLVFSARCWSIALSSMVGGAAAAVLGVRGLFLANALVLGGYLLVLRRRQLAG